MRRMLPTPIRRSTAGEDRHGDAQGDRDYQVEHEDAVPWHEHQHRRHRRRRLLRDRDEWQRDPADHDADGGPGQQADDDEAARSRATASRTAVAPDRPSARSSANSVRRWRAETAALTTSATRAKMPVATKPSSSAPMIPSATGSVAQAAVRSTLLTTSGLANGAAAERARPPAPTCRARRASHHSSTPRTSPGRPAAAAGPAWADRTRAAGCAGSVVGKASTTRPTEMPDRRRLSRSTTVSPALVPVLGRADPTLGPLASRNAGLAITGTAASRASMALAMNSTRRADGPAGQNPVAPAVNVRRPSRRRDRRPQARARLT